jgi:hypothetical protein
MEHIEKRCDIHGCQEEAEYWIDTDNGFIEQLMANRSNTGTFYLCGNHKCDISEDEVYRHLRIDTGEVWTLEIGMYQCHPDCTVCS